MQYFSDKVVQVNGKLFTSCEILDNANKNGKIVIVREIAKTSRTYEHPITGPNTIVKYDIFRGSKKAFIDEQEWEALPNINEENLRVDLGSMR